MALRYAILGYLSTAPGSGYDLAQQLQGGLGWFWSASHSQIYPELKRLEDAGLVESEPTTVGEKLEKRIYSITDEGRRVLTGWAGGAPVYRPNRDPERLQFIFSDLAPLENIRQHLEVHREHFTKRRDQLLETHGRIVRHEHERVERRYEGRDPLQQELTLLLRDLAYRGDVARAELEIRWADDALEHLDALERKASVKRRRAA
jgi:PadR family transcriptional regulator, regulatory protein AphA